MLFFRFILVVWPVILSFGALAQNLVPNPSFEALVQKPCRIISDPTIDNISKYVMNWVSPTNGTSDLHTNEAQPDSACRIGLTRTGYSARTGNACGGLFTVNPSPRVALSTKLPNYREYLQCKLVQKLIPGKVYYVEFYVNPYPILGRTSCYTNNIGCYFSTDSIHQPLNPASPAYILSNKPQINERQLVSRPGQWHKISGCFQATEAAQYLTIGNFFTDNETQYTEFDQNGWGAYYLVDDVSVRESGLTSLPVLAIGDTTLCPAQTITLSLPTSPQTQYQWQDGSTSSSYSLTQAGIYSVTATSGACVVIDTFKVTQEVVLRLPPDTTLCRGASLVLQPLASFNKPIEWSDGSSSSKLEVTDSGLYWIRSRSPSCRQSDSIWVNVVDCSISIPNIFTPNNDGINDTFFINGIGETAWRLEVYNRWGRRVYTSEAYHNDWKGEELPTGIYYYLLSSSAFSKHYKGWVTILF
jgi:gliding motility-associated-like protein